MKLQIKDRKVMAQDSDLQMIRFTLETPLKVMSRVVVSQTFDDRGTRRIYEQNYKVTNIETDTFFVTRNLSGWMLSAGVDKKQYELIKFSDLTPDELIHEALTLPAAEGVKLLTAKVVAPASTESAPKKRGDTAKPGAAEPKAAEPRAADQDQQEADDLF